MCPVDGAGRSEYGPALANMQFPMLYREFRNAKRLVILILSSIKLML